MTGAAPVCEGAVTYHGGFESAVLLTTQEATAAILQSSMVPASVSCGNSTRGRGRGRACTFTTSPCADHATVVDLFAKLRLNSALVNVAEPVTMGDDFHIRRQVADSIAAATGVNHDQITILSIGPDGTVKFVVEDGAQRYASRAVQFHPHGGQSDFVWLSARTPHGGASYVWCLTARRNQEKYPPEKYCRSCSCSGTATLQPTA